mmetsp:Transcript_126/g.124  ORF Transcript_126/g.124 Transcript_126/m.124 type:complete len:262 (+) Transcript_126:386-1171(+)
MVPPSHSHHQNIPLRSSYNSNNQRRSNSNPTSTSTSSTLPYPSTFTPRSSIQRNEVESVHRCPNLPPTPPLRPIEKPPTKKLVARPKETTKQFAPPLLHTTSFPNSSSLRGIYNTNKPQIRTPMNEEGNRRSGRSTTSPGRILRTLLPPITPPLLRKHLLLHSTSQRTKHLPPLRLPRSVPTFPPISTPPSPPLLLPQPPFPQITNVQPNEDSNSRTRKRMILTDLNRANTSSLSSTANATKACSIAYGFTRSSSTEPTRP